jgi:heterotetrameric sarcosine oxidase delta subunit
MQRIECPWCGERPQIEFSYYRDAEAVPPAREWEQDIDAQLRRIYLRKNHVGFHSEIWQHVMGCRQWLRVLRNNLTHEVADCEPASTIHEVPAR